jgi:hypothetical protein
MEVHVLIEYYLTVVVFHNLCHMIKWFGNLAEMFGNVQIAVVFEYRVFWAKSGVFILSRLFSSSNVANNNSN